jgi:hypothetical protein
MILRTNTFFFPCNLNTWCKNQGGEIAVPMADENFHEIMDIAERIVGKDIHKKFMHASGSLIIWGGVTDQWEVGNWVNPYTKEHSDAAFWEAGSPNGGEAKNCVRTYLDRRWRDVYCGKKDYALCYFPERMNQTFRGGYETKKMEGYFDTLYFLKGFVNLKPHWPG